MKTPGEPGVFGVRDPPGNPGLDSAKAVGAVLTDTATGDGGEPECDLGERRLYPEDRDHEPLPHTTSKGGPHCYDGARIQPAQDVAATLQPVAHRCSGWRARWALRLAMGEPARPASASGAADPSARTFARTAVRPVEIEAGSLALGPRSRSPVAAARASHRLPPRCPSPGRTAPRVNPGPPGPTPLLALGFEPAPPAARYRSGRDEPAASPECRSGASPIRRRGDTRACG